MSKCGVCYRNYEIYKIMNFEHNRLNEAQDPQDRGSTSLKQTLADIKHFVNANFFGANLKYDSRVG